MIAENRSLLLAIAVGSAVLRLAIGLLAPETIIGIPRSLITVVLSLALTLSCAALATDFLLEAINPAGEDAGTRRTTPKLLSMLIVGLVWLAALLALLYLEFDFSITGALAASGAVAVILGFALRSILLDLFFGIAFALDGEISIGDWIEIGGSNVKGPSAGNGSVFGQVDQISWRLTRIKLGGPFMFLLVPNSVIGQSAVTNYSRPPGPKRLRYSVRLRDTIPVERALRVLQGAAERAVRHPGLSSSPGPQVMPYDIDSRGVEYLVSYYFDPDVTPPAKARGIMVGQLQRELSRNLLSSAPDVMEVGRFEPVASALGEVSRQAVLSGIPIFSDSLTSEHMSQLSELLEARQVRAGTKVVEAGEEGDSMYLIVDGALAVRIVNDSGKEVEVAALSSGDYFGEMSLLTGAPRTATVAAITDATVLEIEKADVEELLMAQPQIAERLSEVLAERQAGLESARLDTDEDDLEERKDSIAKALLGKISSYFNLKKRKKSA